MFFFLEIMECFGLKTICNCDLHVFLINYNDFVVDKVVNPVMGPQPGVRHTPRCLITGWTTLILKAKSVSSRKALQMLFKTQMESYFD